MSESAVIDRHPPRVFTADLVGAFLVAATAMGIGLCAVGMSLGLFFGGIVLAAILAPYATMMTDSWPRRFILLAGLIDGIGVIWLMPVIDGPVSLVEWLLAYLLLIAFAGAIAGVTTVLRAFHLPPLFASGVATFLAAAWLAWPIWLAPHLASQRLVNVLVTPHPLFAMNGILRNLGIWTEHAVMYRLTPLGQDVPYQLPSPLVAIAVHGLMAVVMLAISAWLRPREDRPPGA